MIRKTYKIQEHTTFKELLEVTEQVEKRLTHMYCKVELHRKQFEVVCKEGTISQSEEMIIHNLCRKLWDNQQ